MLLVNARFAPNGRSQNPASAAPTAPTRRTSAAWRLIRPRCAYDANAASVKRTASNVGTMCDRPARARTRAVRPRPRPVRSITMRSPAYNTTSERLIENENSPAIVDKMLPPRMRKCRANRNGKVAIPSNREAVGSRPAIRPRRRHSHGSVRMPTTVTSLYAIAYGSRKLSATISHVGAGK